MDLIEEIDLKYRDRLDVVIGEMKKVGFTFSTIQPIIFEELVHNAAK